MDLGDKPEAAPEIVCSSKIFMDFTASKMQLIIFVKIGRISNYQEIVHDVSTVIFNG